MESKTKNKQRNNKKNKKTKKRNVLLLGPKKGEKIIQKIKKNTNKN